jgi:hypothetical protein
VGDELEGSEDGGGDDGEGEGEDHGVLLSTSC